MFLMPDPTLSPLALYTQRLNQKNTKFVAADTTTAKTIFKAGTNGSLITSITVSTDETTLNGLILSELEKTVSYHKERFLLPSNTPYGTDGTNGELTLLPLIEGAIVDGAGNYAYYLAGGKALQLAVVTTVGAAKTITVKVKGEDF